MATNPDGRAGVERCDRPPSEPLQFVPIYSAVPQTNIHLVCLSRNVVGVWTHYYLERTVPCIGRHNGCICSNVQLARRWKGYLGAWDPMLCRVVLAEITSDCFRSAEHSAFAAGNDLRGRAFILFRLGHRRNSPARCTWGIRLPDWESKLPEEPNVVKCLYRIWGIPDN